MPPRTEPDEGLPSSPEAFHATQNPISGKEVPAMGHKPQGVHLNAMVRRLTPTECERLQGMPDGWTWVP